MKKNILIILILVFCSCNNNRISNIPISKYSESEELISDKIILIPQRNIFSDDQLYIGNIKNNKLTIILPYKINDNYLIDANDFFGISKDDIITNNLKLMHFLTDPFLYLIKDPLDYYSIQGFIYSNKNGKINYLGNKLELKRGWNIRFNNKILPLTNNLYKDGYKWFYFVNKNKEND
jgi:hypothetical protein